MKTDKEDIQPPLKKQDGAKLLKSVMEFPDLFKYQSCQDDNPLTEAVFHVQLASCDGESSIRCESLALLSEIIVAQQQCMVAFDALGVPAESMRLFQRIHTST